MQPFRSDRILGFAALGFLIVGCFLVLRPFLSAVLWAAILATTVWPVFHWVDQRLPGWRNTSALLTTLATALVLVAPFIVVAVGLGSNVAELAAATRTLLEGGLPTRPSGCRTSPSSANACMPTGRASPTTASAWWRNWASWWNRPRAWC